MKIPFERTIASAYRFAFTNILSIIGIGWFPFLLFAALMGGLVYLWMPQIAEFFSMIGKPQDAQAFDAAHFISLLAPLAGSYLLIIIGFVLAQSMVSVGLMRKALGQHPGPVFIFFTLGGQVWRLIGSYLMLMVIAWGVLLGFVLAIGGVSLLLDNVWKPGAVAVTVILAIAAAFWAIYAIVRVSFFIPAVVVAENHIGIRRAWHLGRGNFWRIIGISLIVTLPLAFAVNTITSTIFQMALGDQFAGIQTGAMSPEDGQKLVMEMLHAAGRVWPYYVVLQLVNFVLQAGLTVGASANAYLAVTAPNESAAPPAQASA